MKQRISQTYRPYITISDRPASRITEAGRNEVKTLVYSLIALVMTLSIVLATGVANASESGDAGVTQHRYCNPKVSKPCGKGCVLLAKSCRIPWTTSRVGIKPRASNAVESPKYVDTAPQ